MLFTNPGLSVQLQLADPSALEMPHNVDFEDNWLLNVKISQLFPERYRKPRQSCTEHIFLHPFVSIGPLASRGPYVSLKPTFLCKICSDRFGFDAVIPK